MSTSYRFEQVPADTRRARGLQVAATLAFEPDAFAQRYGVSFEPVADDLGETIGALLEMTPSGKQFGVYKHVEAPYPGLELYADIDSEDLQSDIAHFMEALGLDRRDLYDMIGTRTFADDRPEEPEEPADLVRAPAESAPRATAVDLAIEDQRALHGSLRQRDWASLVLLTVGACFVAALISAALLFAAPGSVSYGAILAGVVPAIGTLVLMLAEVERRRALQLAEGIQALRMKLDPSGGRDPGPSPLMARFNLRGHPSLALAATVTLLLTSASAVVGLVSLAQHAHWVAFALFAALSAATIAGSAVASRWVILHVGFARARADEVADKLRR